MSTAPAEHPAVFSDTIMAQLFDVLTAEADDVAALYGRPMRVLDPMAGIGTIHRLAGPGIKTFGIELEPEWAQAHRRTRVGDATQLPRWWSRRFDATVTSPDYGNRMADSFDARDSSSRVGYRWQLGRKLSDESVVVRWGSRYRQLHELVLSEMVRVTRPGGLVIVNISDFIEKGEVVPVVDWYRSTLTQWLTLPIERDIEISTPRMRKGQNWQARVDVEPVIVCRRP